MALDGHMGGTGDHAGRYSIFDMVSFTGSVATGSLIMESAAKNVVKPLLELGGKSPSIVFEDVDLAETLPWIMHGFLSNAGQVCISQGRLLVQNRKLATLVQASVFLRNVSHAIWLATGQKIGLGRV